MIHQLPLGAASHAEQRERAHALLASSGFRQALFAARSSVLWLTGFAPPVNLGPHPFAGGPPLVWYDAGAFTLIVADAHAPAAAAGLEVLRYTGYTLDGPIMAAANLTAALGSVVPGAARGALGVELADLPAALARALPPDAGIVPIDGWLEPLRRRKTGPELALLRANFDLAAVGQRAASAAVRAGSREIDVWNALERAIQSAVGERVAVGNDCVVGYRDMNLGGWPGAWPIRPGDSLIVDLSTQIGGYWSDSCATYYAGPPSERQAAMHRVALAALELAISLARPGAIAGEIDRQVRQHITDAGYPVYPHHTGHGVGVTPHEEPRIVPYSRLALEPGMVVMLEPGIYLPGETAVRLEHAVLVTEGAPELLTSHAIDLP